MSVIGRVTHTASYRRRGSGSGPAVTRTVLAERLGQLSAALPGLVASDDAWIEALPFGADDRRAHALRERLQRCPIEGRAASPLRVAAMLYQDGSVDLVVAADAAQWGRAGMHRVAECLLDGAALPAADAFDTPAALPATHAVYATPDPQWAGSRPTTPPSAGPVVVERPLPRELPDGIDRPAAVAAALSHALALRTHAAAVALRVEIAAPLAGSVPAPDVSRVVVVPTAGARPAHAAAFAVAWHRAVAAGAGVTPEPSSPVAAVLQWPLDGAMGDTRWRTLDDAPMRISVAEAAEAAGWRIEVHARPQAVSAQAAEALVDDVVTALSPAAAQPPAPPAPRAAHVAARNLPELIASTCARQAEAQAIAGRSGRLTYAQLQRRADAVARSLQAAGCGRGDLVGVCMSRDIGFVVAMLGVMAAGAAYVPLDPSYPDERLRYTAQDAKLALVIAERPREAWAGVPQWCVGADGTFGDAAPAMRRAPAAAAATMTAGREDLAYVIYTSGSTGQPKGAMIEHASVLSLIEGCARLFTLGPSDTWTCFHSFAFDFSVWEAWGCLATGGRLLVVDEAEARSPTEFLRLLHAERVTILNQTPSAFAQLVVTEAAAPADLSLRLVILAGEALQPRLLLRWFDRHGEDSCAIVNMYGITETTVHCTWKRLTRTHALRDDRSIGVPIPGWSAHVLDAQGRPCAEGVPGEIWIGGDGVARGYLARPGLTATRFRAVPVGSALGHRLYRSGDKGRRRADGEIEYLGRLDHQVKIRGYRIELGEIRARLLEAPGVQDAAVVVARRGEAQDAFIDAYVVGPGVRVAELRRRLADVLPAYMVPATLTRLEALPLTINGKVDQRRLAPATAPDDVAAAASTIATPAAPSVERAPTTPAAADAAAMEDRVATIWRQVLGVDVGPDDNFFLVGGNSLLAIRVTRRMQDDAIAHATARHLYANPTVRGLCAALRTGR